MDHIKITIIPISFITMISNFVAIICRKNIYRQLDICPIMTILQRSVITAREICRDFLDFMDITCFSISGIE